MNLDSGIPDAFPPTANIIREGVTDELGWTPEMQNVLEQAKARLNAMTLTERERFHQDAHSTTKTQQPQYLQKMISYFFGALCLWLIWLAYELKNAPLDPNDP